MTKTELAKMVFRATGTGAMAETLSRTKNWIVYETRLHLSDGSGNDADGATTENFTVRLSDASVPYNAKFFEQDTQGVGDVFDVVPHNIRAGGELEFTWANADGLTWGLEVFYDEAV